MTKDSISGIIEMKGGLGRYKVRAETLRELNVQWQRLMIYCTRTTVCLCGVNTGEWLRRMLLWGSLFGASDPIQAVFRYFRESVFVEAWLFHNHLRSHKHLPFFVYTCPPHCLSVFWSFSYCLPSSSVNQEAAFSLLSVVQNISTMIMGTILYAWTKRDLGISATQTTLLDFVVRMKPAALLTSSIKSAGK